jgi:hypothetical protein
MTTQDRINAHMSLTYTYTPLTKLDAMRILASAYHHLSDTEAREMLAYAFGYVRRSLRLEDLRPLPACKEGWNGKGPVYL